MDSADDHLEKSRKNWSFLDTLDCSGDAHADWHVIVLFYTALQLVDRFLHDGGEDHGTSHGRRNQVLRRLVDDGRLSGDRLTDYLQLYSRARALRYEELQTGAAEFTQLLRHFRDLESELTNEPFASFPKLAVEA
jgi:hypothetical protein